MDVVEPNPPAHPQDVVVVVDDVLVDDEEGAPMMSAMMSSTSSPASLSGVTGTPGPYLGVAGITGVQGWPCSSKGVVNPRNLVGADGMMWSGCSGTPYVWGLWVLGFEVVVALCVFFWGGLWGGLQKS